MSSRGSAPFFDVTIPKLVVMSIVTLGFYPFYWHYRNWEKVKNEPGFHDIKPFWRAAFAVFYCVSLFKHMARACEHYLGRRCFDPGTMAFLFIILTAQEAVSGLEMNGQPILTLGMFPSWLSELLWWFAFVPLAIVQTHVNAVHRQVAPHPEVNGLRSQRTLMSVGVIGIVVAIFIGFNSAARDALGVDEMREQAQVVAEQYFELRLAGDLEAMDTLFVLDAHPNSSPYCQPSTASLFELVNNNLGTLQSYEFAAGDVSASNKTSYVSVVFVPTYSNVTHGGAAEALVMRRNGMNGEFKIEAVEVGWGTETETLFYSGWGTSSCPGMVDDPHEWCPCAMGPAIGLPVCEQ